MGASEAATRFSELCNFAPKQLEATRTADRVQFFLYGGSRGPGKSHWLRWWDVRQLIRLSREGIHQPVGALFCENYPSLKDRQISKISQFPVWLGEIRDSKAFGLGFHLRREYGGGVLLLRNLDDASKYQSTEFAFISVDELTKNRKDTFDKLRGSLRWPGIAKPKFVAATNPGSIGHGWVKQLWVDRKFPPELIRYADDFAFLPALPEDNPHLTSDYWEMLESLPPNLARAWRWGEWEIFAGLFFDTWRSTAGEGQTCHVVEPFQIPADWPLYGSVDYGHNAGNDDEKPFVYGLYTVAPNGRCYLIDELAAAGWGVGKQAEEVRRLESRYPQHVIYRVGCKSMFTEWKKGAPTVAEDYAAAGVPVIEPHSDRLSGWARCREWLKPDPSGTPWFQAFSRCTQFIKIVSSVILDERHPEDIDPRSEDHAVEQWRHFLMSRPSPCGTCESEAPVFSAAWMARRRVEG
ncbi:MAG TPA: hypothetical protein VHS28_06775 [Chloroflexota bacterium]|nr:hypothetical protein [Chloroflexota bacterium]